MFEHVRSCFRLHAAPPQQHPLGSRPIQRSRLQSEEEVPADRIGGQLVFAFPRFRVVLEPNR